jgi:hypothetical protein
VVVNRAGDIAVLEVKAGEIELAREARLVKKQSAEGACSIRDMICRDGALH